jgi:hypothetical protein
VRGNLGGGGRRMGEEKNGAQRQPMSFEGGAVGWGFGGGGMRGGSGEGDYHLGRSGK